MVILVNLSIFGLVWYGMVRSDLGWFGMVDGYCLDVIPCKIWKSYFEKQLSYGQYTKIWFGLVWLGMVWFGLEWDGIWVLSICSYMQNFELLA